jgi:indolepyruvate ferredoxin oxidoreductase beta subunit
MVGETYGASQRGGPVMSHVRIGGEELGPLVPSRKAHVLLGFEPVETLRVGAKYLNPESSVIMNTRPIYPAEVLAGVLKYPEVEKVIGAVKALCRNFWAINAVELAEKAGSPRVMNIVMLGALAATKLLPFQPEDFKEAINERIQRLKETNLRAFELGLKAV